MSGSESRREFVKKAAYVAPAVVTFTVQPAFAGSGSCGPDRPPRDDDHHHHHGPRGRMGFVKPRPRMGYR